MTMLQKTNKKIGIFGLGKTGISAYLSLSHPTNTLFCYDDNLDKREEFAIQYGLSSIKDIANQVWKKLDMIILSPGIPFSHKIVKLANQYNIPIVSDIELLYQESKNSEFITITGTNGKSTTSALIHHILKQNSINYPLIGNIGTPVLSIQSNKTGYILEISSFQIDLLKNFRTKIAVLLNVTEDHIERYGNIKNYEKSKKKIFNFLDKDSYAIINIDSDSTNKIFHELKEYHSNMITISSNRSLNSTIFINRGMIHDKKNNINISIPKNVSLQGEHNYQNIAASYIVCKLLKLDTKKILDAITTFKGLPHRMQYIGNLEKNNIKINFFNDSKATNADSALYSLGALKNVYWLVGGISKSGGIKKLQALSSRISRVYCFGQDKNILVKQIKDTIPSKICSDLKESFYQAYNDAIKDSKNESNILLAPACSSYDQFKNFEERGELFIKLYETLKKNFLS